MEKLRHSGIGALTHFLTSEPLNRWIFGPPHSEPVEHTSKVGQKLQGAEVGHGIRRSTRKHTWASEKAKCSWWVDPCAILGTHIFHEAGASSLEMKYDKF
ncbi:hypothetical protein MN608_02787 [Microdochium nivale]|nr:hypothetical protein MN608_02787 [Microdochium nivale]